MKFLPALALLVSLIPATGMAGAQGGTIVPGAVWLDSRGKPIQAHGGGVLKYGDTWYWFGEDRSRDLPPNERAVACYSSRDLVNWEYRKRVLTLWHVKGVNGTPILERPKVYWNAKTGKFVMYMHIDSPGYGTASVGVAICDTVDGDYRFLRYFRPLGMESRDIGQFVDDDGSAYLIFESRPTGGFVIARLSDDFLNVDRQVCLVPEPLEGGALVHYEGRYYVIGSHLTSWDPNPNVYATADHLEGPWSDFADIAPPESNTYGSQSTFLLTVTGTRSTTIVFMGDIWKPKTLWDSRYLWMPIEIDGGGMHLPTPRPWGIDAATGEVSFPGK